MRSIDKILLIECGVGITLFFLAASQADVGAAVVALFVGGLTLLAASL
jgi:hypothetical protein